MHLHIVISPSNSNDVEDFSRKYLYVGLIVIHESEYHMIIQLQFLIELFLHNGDSSEHDMHDSAGFYTAYI